MIAQMRISLPFFLWAKLLTTYFRIATELFQYSFVAIR